MLLAAPFVSGTLKIYLTESQEREGGTLANANISGDLPALPYCMANHRFGYHLGQIFRNRRGHLSLTRRSWRRDQM